MKTGITFLTAFLIFLGIELHAQTFVLRDQNTGTPIPGASVKSHELNISLITDLDGQVDFKELKGADDIVIELIGYPTVYTSYEKLEKDGFQLNISPRLVSLHSVVISANRWTQVKREIPARITTITPEQRALGNPQTAADMLGQSGEVFIQKSQFGGGSPMIRGFSANRLLYTVDGVRMNNAIFRSGNLQNVISLNPFFMENTEIYFGPGSVMYGSDAIGAVMNFSTWTPAFADSAEVHGSAAVRYASASDEFTTHAQFTYAGKKAAFYTGFTSSSFQSLQMGSFGPSEYLRPSYVVPNDTTDLIIQNNDPEYQRFSGFNQNMFLHKGVFKLKKNTTLGYNIHSSVNTEFNRYDRLIQESNGLPRYAEWKYGPQLWTMQSLQLKSEQMDRALIDKLSVTLARQVFEESRIDRDFLVTDRRTRTENVHAYSLNIDAAKLFNNAEFFYGLEVIRNNVFSQGENEDIFTLEKSEIASRYPDANWNSVSIYGTYQHELSEKLAIQAGVRYAQFHINADFSDNLEFYPFSFESFSTQHDAITGSTGLTWNPWEHTSLYGHFSTGFRAPNVDDLGKLFDSEPGSVVVPNANLEEEYAYNFEVGGAQLIGNHLKVEASAYYTLLNNALVRRDFTIDGQDSILYDGVMSRVQAVQNAAEAYVRGLQIGAEFHFMKNLVLQTQFNWQEGEEELDDGTTGPMRHAAPTFGQTSLRLRHRRWTFIAQSQYNGEMTFEDLPVSEQNKPHIYAQNEEVLPYAPAWMILNLRIKYHLNPHIQFTGGLENITDRRYRSFSSGITAPGRNLIISAQVRL